MFLVGLSNCSREWNCDNSAQFVFFHFLSHHGGLEGTPSFCIRHDKRGNVLLIYVPPDGRQMGAAEYIPKMPGCSLCYNNDHIQYRQQKSVLRNNKGPMILPMPDLSNRDLLTLSICNINIIAVSFRLGNVLGSTLHQS